MQSIKLKPSPDGTTLHLAAASADLSAATEATLTLAIAPVRESVVVTATRGDAPTGQLVDPGEEAEDLGLLARLLDDREADFLEDLLGRFPVVGEGQDEAEQAVPVLQEEPHEVGRRGFAHSLD